MFKIDLCQRDEDHVSDLKRRLTRLLHFHKYKFYNYTSRKLKLRMVKIRPTDEKYRVK